MTIRVGRWDCPACGLKGNMGPDTHCAGCGSPRGKEVKFYLPEDAEEVTDADKIKLAKSGADWLCKYCGADNKALDTGCRSCGNQRDQDDKARQEKVRYFKEDQIELKPVTPPTVKKKRSPWVVLAILAVIAASVWMILKPRDFSVEVAGHQWKRTVDIEQYKAFVEEDWAVPAGGKTLSTRQDIHHYNQVPDGYETKTRTVRVQTGTKRVKCGSRDLGNGYFEDVYCNEPVYTNKTETYQETKYRAVPVFQTKYKYEIWRWSKEKTLTASGSDKNAVFPSEPLPNDQWRVGKKTEEYVLVLKDKKGKTYEEKVNYNFWQTMAQGNSVKAKKNALGNFYGLDDPAAKASP